MFCIRDFIAKGNNRAHIEAMLKKDINDIWAKMYKPEKFKDSQPDSFFQFEYCMLPHKDYAEE